MGSPDWYLKHALDARHHRKIKLLEHKYGKHVGYALWFKTLESMTDYPECGFRKDDIEIAACCLDEEPEMYKEFIAFCLRIELLSYDDSGTIVSTRLVENMQKIRSKSENISKARLKQEAEKRYQPQSPDPKPDDHTPENIPAKTPAKHQEILDYWNSKNITHHRKITNDIKKGMEKRLKEYTPDQIKQAIDNYKKAITSDPFWINRATEWTLDLFLSRQGGMPKFLTWEPGKGIGKQYTEPETKIF